MYKCDVTMTVTGFVSETSWQVVRSYGYFLKKHKIYDNALIVFANMKIMLEKRGV